MEVTILRDGKPISLADLPSASPAVTVERRDLVEPYRDPLMLGPNFTVTKPLVRPTAEQLAAGFEFRVALVNVWGIEWDDLRGFVEDVAARLVTADGGTGPHVVYLYPVIDAILSLLVVPESQLVEAEV